MGDPVLCFQTVDDDCVLHFNVFWKRQVERQRGKQAKGEPWWGKRKGEVHCWWCPTLWRWLTEADFHDTIRELTRQAQQYDVALEQDRLENLSRSALNQTIFKIAEVKGFPEPLFKIDYANTYPI